jgi:hypothetical protein
MQRTKKKQQQQKHHLKDVQYVCFFLQMLWQPSCGASAGLLLLLLMLLMPAHPGANIAAARSVIMCMGTCRKHHHIVPAM